MDRICDPLFYRRLIINTILRVFLGLSFIEKIVKHLLSLVSKRLLQRQFTFSQFDLIK